MTKQRRDPEDVILYEYAYWRREQQDDTNSEWIVAYCAGAMAACGNILGRLRGVLPMRGSPAANRDGGKASGSHADHAGG